MRSAVVALALIASCGRIGFEPGQRGADASASGDADAPLSTGLVRWLQFESAAPLRDEVTGADATCTACPQIIAGGPRGDAVLLSEGTCLQLADAPELQLESLSLATWVRIDAGAGDGTLVGKSLDGATSFANSFELFLGAPEALQFVLEPEPAIDWRFEATTLPVGSWHHVAVTRVGPDVRGYLDGSEVATMTFPGGPVAYAGDPVRIGCDEDIGVERGYFDGALDDVRIYDRALGPAEIAELAAP